MLTLSAKRSSVLGPQRVYHDQSHLTWLLDEADRRAALIRDPAFVGCAIWFHDLAMRVAQVIEMPKDHAHDEAEGDAALFLDINIAILGSPWETYCAYAAGIRWEYPHIVDPAFAGGRGAFREKQLQHVRTFRTDLYEQEIGEAARANLRWELEEMRKGRMVKG